MPDAKRDHRRNRGGSILTARGLMNLGTLFILGLALFMLFAGYPIYEEIRKRQPRTLGAFKCVSPLVDEGCLQGRSGDG
jgi:hypothetical protein